MASQTLTQQRLKNLLNYDPSTGIFTRRITRGGMYAGSVVGTLSTHGYRKIMVDKVAYAAHRLAWLYVYGNFPGGEIDHINRDRCDNRIVNLRIASRKDNARNKGVSKRNTSGAKGVSWDRQTKKWRAQISVSGKSISIGRFDKKSDAVIAYGLYAVSHFGEFAAVDKGASHE
ncbi:MULTISPECIES: HNH endonuclease [Enterobacteriaceae]|uniref:HNH endonuclease n=1 Tax=Enterobacteriaceae TaxID=543 RepID=UPI000448E9BB|nr:MULTISPECIES: HNH endonuclease [Enterobacteriaceae]EFL4461577.1 hypothetical protein [Escherichia coli]EMD6907146.1 HNH endonuclease [Citrobacter freundii]EGM0691802.1 hypothetical protein [Escherichia coli]EHI7025959.1 hypothetical protein [Escherichia coli]EHP6441398.1 HNH endonuclease [Escherichia coli]